MNIIGIDFSINSTGICIRHSEGLEWFNFTSNLDFNRKPYRIHKELNEFDNIHIIGYQREKPKNLEYSEEQSWKLENADMLSNLIIQTINPWIHENSIIGFEGFSFGSKGNSFIDLITYNTFLKSKIMNINKNKIQVISPKRVKKEFSGNGNASKSMMLQSFIDNDIDIDILIEDPLKRYIINNNIDTIKPIDDLVDSFAILNSIKVY